MREHAQDPANGSLRLEGRRVLITGGAVRVGRELSRVLAREGAELLIHYNQSGRAASELAAELTGAGAQVSLVQADFTRTDAAEAVARAVRSRWDRLDVIINSASVWPSPERVKAPAVSPPLTAELWDTTFSVQVRTPYFLFQELLSLLSKTGRGVVLNLLDESFETPFPSRPAYSAAKAGLHLLGQLFAADPSLHVVSMVIPPILPPEQLPEQLRQKLKWHDLDRFMELCVQTIVSEKKGFETIRYVQPL